MRVPSISPRGATTIDRLLASAVDDGMIPKAVAMVANRHQHIYSGAFGKKDVANDIELQLDSLFSLKSMTKPVTSVATMMLAERGAFNLDDPVSAYLPRMANPEVVTSIDREARTYATEPAKSKITIRQLLTHTAGFAYGFSNQTMQNLIGVSGIGDAISLPLIHHPGTAWTYSAGTALLGELIEKLSEMPLDAFLQARIFAPLGMNDTAFHVPAEKIGRVVTVHQRIDGKLLETPTPDTVQSPARGETGLYGTASDYIRFLQMLLNGGQLEGNRLLSEASVNAMLRNQIGSLRVGTQLSADPAASSHFPFAAGTDTFGLGFQITASNATDPDLRMPGSFSWGGLFNTHFWGDPEREIVAVILMQQLPFYSDDTMDVYQGFEKRVNRNLLR